ncbi:MAG: hypothetical protein LUE27_03090, partial [Clostridia bacterium]|nr:hypothetical protein [Clostridia bacterium]
GYKTYKCARCADIYEEITAAPAGHNWGDWTSTGTSTVDGETVTNYERTCSVCNAKDTKYTKSGSTEGEEVTVSVWDGETVDYGNLIDLTDSGETAEVSVSTAAQLAGLAAYVNGEYDSTTTVDSTLSEVEITLDADIDLTSKDWTPIGDNDGTTSIPFSGSFDGNGYTISNLTVDSDDSEIGLFGYTDTAEITGVTINNVSLSGTGGVGAIIGQCDMHGSETTCTKVSNCSVTGLIQISGNFYVGGIIGIGMNTEIESCSVTASEGSYIKGIFDEDKVYSDTSYCGQYIGGIAGSITTSSTSTESGIASVEYIYDVSVSGVAGSELEISGTMYVGGIAGNYSWAKTSGTCKITTNPDNEGDGNSVSNCIISITPAPEDYTYMSGHYEENFNDSNKSSMYVGAIIGYARRVEIENCTISNVTVYYYYEKCVYAGDSNNDYFGKGYYGYGSNTTIYSATCSGTVTVRDLATLTSTE